MAAGFFRKSALEKLSTPEKLDQLIKVTGSRSWIALSLIGAVLLIGLAWACLGTVKTKLDVVGVIQGGEVHEVVSTAQGQLVALKVIVGDQVRKGDVIATIQQPELLQQIEDAKAVLSERRFEMGKIASYGTEGSQIQGEYVVQTRKSINGEIETQRKKLDYLFNQLESENVLLNKGLITKSQVANTKHEISVAQNNIERLKGQMVEASSQQHTINFDTQQKTSLQAQRIDEAQRNLQFLKEKYETEKNIKSPFDGEVIEALTDRGVVVEQGTPLFKVKNIGNANVSKLTGVLYIPSKDGKKIKKGMEVLVAPSTIQPQEFGYIKAKITYVSDFPITERGMLTSVKNDQLAKGLLAGGPLFEVHVDFEKDPSSYSGYKWTSANGPEIIIKEGTSCIGKVTIKEETPIAIVVPAFKKFFDLY